MSPGPPPDPNKSGRHLTKKAVVDVQVVQARLPGQPIPDPPAGMTRALVDEWVDLWESPLAETLAITDLPPLRRLWTQKWMLEQYVASLGEPIARALADDDDAKNDAPWGYSFGSQGQLVKHPGLEAILALEKSIVAGEDRFGLSVKARQSIGIRMGALVDAKKKVDEAKAEANEEKRSERADPRESDIA